MTKLASEEVKMGMIRLYQDGYSLVDAAARYGYCGYTCLNALKQYGIPRRNRHEAKRKIGPEEDQQIAEQYLAGNSGTAIAKLFGVFDQAIYKSLERSGIVRRLHEEYYTVLTDGEKEEICEAYRNGESSNTIGKRIGLSGNCVIRMLREHGVVIRETSEANRLYSLKEDAFADAAESEEAAYFVGLLMADGCVNYPKRHGSPTITIHLAASDDSVIVGLCKFLETDHPIYYREPKGKGKKMMAGISVSSQMIAGDLARYGVRPRKSLKECFSGGMEWNRHAWRGAVDGDGWVGAGHGRNRKADEFGLCGSESFIRQFSEYCASICKETSSCHPRRGRGDLWRLSFTGIRAAAILRNLYEPCSIAMPRKLAAANIGMKYRDDRATSPLSITEVTHNGETMSISAWSRKTGIHRRTIAARMRLGWSIERSLETPTGNYSVRGS